jgi:CHASE1-domain containing sensor protein
MPPETFTYRFFAKHYHFTEAMTDESSLEAVMWWPVIEQAEAEAAQRQMRDAQRHQQNGRLSVSSSASGKR